MVSTSGTSSERIHCTQSESPTDAVNVATNRTTSETVDGAEAASSVSRRGDGRIIINTKDQLKKFMFDHLRAPLEPFAIDC